MVRASGRAPPPPHWLPLVAVASWPREPWLRYDRVEEFLRDVYITHTGSQGAPTVLAALSDDARVLLRLLHGALAPRQWTALRRTLHRWCRAVHWRSGRPARARGRCDPWHRPASELLDGVMWDGDGDEG